MAQARMRQIMSIVDSYLYEPAISRDTQAEELVEFRQSTPQFPTGDRLRVFYWGFRCHDCPQILN